MYKEFFNSRFTKLKHIKIIFPKPRELNIISTKNVTIIGGGPAGFMAAITASENKNLRITLFDKMEETGSKLLITGKGKCNLTHQISRLDELMEGYGSGSQFLNSAFHKFTPRDLIAFFESRGVPCKPDRGKRIFPVSENAKDVRDALLKEAEKLGVTIKVNSPVIEISAENGKVKSLRTSQKEVFPSDQIVIATGGMTYPWTGSTGDGMMFARKLGHTIIPPRPSLVSLEVMESHISFALEGLALKNVKTSLKYDNKIVEQKFGEMVFTSYGVSGPIILYLSRKAVNLLAEKKGDLYLLIDFKPALAKEKISAKLDVDIEKNKKKLFKNLAEEYMPQKLAPIILQESGISCGKQCAQISTKEKNRFCDLLKNFTLKITKPRGMSEAEVTQGGVDLKEIDPKTMESKIIAGLYFAGEVMNVDGYIGGFNLQAAFSTGVCAGKAIASCN